MKFKSLIAMIALVALIAMTALFAGSAEAVIQFKTGWDAPENSDVRDYTKEGATQFLRGKSEDLRKIIDGPQACILEVTKGCHQVSQPHFTVNGAKSTSKCKVDSTYVGSKSDHVPC
ncbi:MAG: hypothetical protein J7647_22870 [Cyanobacteria bacterium SBLK]|nr:hypothetical protein [Cyanobacteria bacterium SBLK]